MKNLMWWRCTHSRLLWFLFHTCFCLFCSCYVTIGFLFQVALWHMYMKNTYMVVSWNRGTPKSSILMGFSLRNHPFGGTPMTMETPILVQYPHVQCFFHYWWNHHSLMMRSQQIPINWLVRSKKKIADVYPTFNIKSPHLDKNNAHLAATSQRKCR